MDSKHIALAATLVCVIVTTRCAIEFTKTRPRLFTVLALFALSWAVLLPYYGDPPAETELLPAFNGFLLVYVGVLLRREADAEQGLPHETRVSPTAGLALWLLYLIAAPSFLSFKLPPEYIPYLDSWIGTLATVLGYWSVTDGVARLHRGSKVWLWMLAIVVPYGLLEVGYSVTYSPIGPMPDSFRYSFAIAKCVFTVTLLALVLLKTLPLEERHPWRLTLRLLGIPGGHP
jgi:hypothetical protein